MAIVAGAATTVVGGLGAIAVASVLSARGPCPPGYVRLVDLDPAFLVALIVLAALGGGLALLAIPRRPHRGVAAAALVVLAVTTVAAVFALLDRVQTAPGASCWTF